MNFQLNPELEKFVDEKVKTGQFGSREEVIEAGLARLMLDPEPELDEETLSELAEGEAQIDHGESRPWEEVKAELVAKYLRK